MGRACSRSRSSIRSKAQQQAISDSQTKPRRLARADRVDRSGVAAKRSHHSPSIRRSAGSMKFVEGRGPREPAMRLSHRVTILFVALVAFPILCTISLSAPSLGQERGEGGANSGSPHAAASRSHHVRGAYIVCPTPDVRSCHKAFKRRHRAHAH